MAEESPDQTDDELLEEVYEELQVYKPQPCRAKCNPRLDELATPNRRMFLALWNQHAYHFPEDKVEHLKEILRNLYAMTPEETARYFAQLRAQARAAATRRKFRQQLQKYLKEKRRKREQARAFRLFRKLLRCGFKYAVRSPVPPVLSVRLRYLSDLVLEQLAALRCVPVPNRCNPDKLGKLLIAIADWISIAIGRLYFATTISINQGAQGDVTDTFETKNISQPLAASTPKSSFDRGQPLATSTPRQSVDAGQPLATSTPKSSFERPSVVSTTLQNLHTTQFPNKSLNRTLNITRSGQEPPFHKLQTLDTVVDLEAMRRDFSLDLTGHSFRETLPVSSGRCKCRRKKAKKRPGKRIRNRQFGKGTDFVVADDGSSWLL